MPKVSMVNFNYYIKEVVRLAGLNEPVRISHKRGNKIREEIRPKYAWISSHTARRAFCKNEYLAGTPSDLIMSISGHKSEKSFRKYIKADQIKKASMIRNYGIISRVCRRPVLVYQVIEQLIDLKKMKPATRSGLR